ncbi:IclR family transcriptional regulator [Litorivita sp. NS0012-18]|uniref:IclR family transcriptional regulator n=1 Tax=Litorivita sp. NS0012-18 TaxID=3127655 RepID=UPI00310368C5
MAKRPAKSSGPSETPPKRDAGEANAKHASSSAVQLIYDDQDLSETLKNDPKFNWSLARGLEILRAFSGRPAPLGNTELSEITGLPKATVSRLTHTLNQLGFLALNPRLGKFELTPAILALGYPVLSSMKTRALSKGYMEDLAREVGLTVALGSRDRSSMIYVDACHPLGMMSLRLDVGSRVEMAKTSLGRAFLWGLSEMERAILFNTFERRYGAEWPALKEAIESSLAQIDACGFCIVDGDWQDDTRGVGVPLFSEDGSVALALNAAGPRFAATIEALEQDVGPRLVHLSRSLQPMLG